MSTFHFAALAAVPLALTVRADVIAHWKFDEPGGPTAFDSVGSRHGTLAGGAVFLPAGGRVGGAIRFASATGDYVTMGDTLPLTGAGPFTLAAWVRTAPGYGTHALIAGRHTSTVVAGYFLAMNDGGGYGRAGTAYFYQSVHPGGEPIGTTPVNDGRWHHVVCVHNQGGQSVIYIDGAPAEGSRGNAVIQPVNAEFVVGGLNFLSAPRLRNAFDGDVDDLQVYDEALCDRAVQHLFDHPGEPLPVCYADCEPAGCRWSLDIFDFLCFQNRYGANDAYACNCDTSSGPGVCDIFDFLCFQNAYAAGCP